jgi:hypothetical protein
MGLPVRVGDRHAAAKPPEEVELMLNYAPKWVDLPSGRGHTHFREYPREGIADWHARRGLTVP